MKWRGRGRTRLPELEWRKRATTATIKKFKGKSFDWEKGRHCLNLAHYHLRKMGKRPPALPKIPNALAAKKALQRRGFDTVTQLLDSLLPRTTAARMRLGDLAAVPGDEGLDAVMIYIAPLQMLTWVPDGSQATFCFVDPDDFTACWRSTGV